MLLFSVLSWNIQGWQDSGEHAWSKRAEMVSDKLKRNGADLIGLQEFADSNLKAIKDALPHHDHELGHLLGDNVYTPLFWNAERFQVEEIGGIYLNENGRKELGWDAENERATTWVELADNLAERRNHLLFINVHLDHIGYIARERSVQLILDFIARDFADDMPIIITGDFNLNLYRDHKKIAPKSRPYGLLTEAGFVDVFHALNGIWPPPTTFHNYEGQEYQVDEWNTRDIDRIFVRNLLPVAASIIESNPASSDHYPILAQVTYSDPSTAFIRM